MRREEIGMVKRIEDWRPRPSVLTADVVIKLRELDAKGQCNVREAAEVYGVAAETIRRALRRETWKHLGREKTKTDEELAEEAGASLERFQRMIAEAKANSPDVLVEELKGTDKPQVSQTVLNKAALFND